MVNQEIRQAAKAAGPQVTISGFLYIGRENALPLAALCQLTGMDGRQVRLMIQQERLKGVPILSGGND